MYKPWKRGETPVNENTHLSHDEIALLIDGGYSEIDAARVTAHVKSCPRCLELFQDATIHASIYNADPGQFEATSELVTLGEGPALANVSKAGATPMARRPLRTGFLGMRRWQTAFSVFVIAIVAAGAWWLGTRSSQPLFGPEVLQPIQSAIEVASARGPIVVPGGENFEHVNPQVYRSGNVLDPEQQAELNETLDVLLAAYQEGSASRELAYWLIAGLFSSGQIDAARDYARDARRSYPDDASIGVLYALVAYTDGDLSRAEVVLRDIVEQDTGNIAARINLSVVLIELGRVDEARQVLADTKRVSSSLSARLHELESEAEGH